MEKTEVDPLSQTRSPLNKELGKKKINLNQATSAELELLPGLGPKLSRRIVEYREINGEFNQIEDVMQVQGIGVKTFERIKDYVTIEEKAEEARK